jgi:hypothetical protein
MYVTAYVRLSSSRTYASFAFEVSTVCHRILLTKIITTRMSVRFPGGLPDTFWGDLAGSLESSPSHPFTSGQCQVFLGRSLHSDRARRH